METQQNLKWEECELWFIFTSLKKPCPYWEGNEWNGEVQAWEAGWWHRKGALSVLEAKLINNTPLEPSFSSRPCLLWVLSQPTAAISVTPCEKQQPSGTMEPPIFFRLLSEFCLPACFFSTPTVPWNQLTSFSISLPLGSRHLRWFSGRESAWWCKRCGFLPWVGKIPWRRKWQPTSVFLPGKSHGQNNLAGYSVHGVAKESNTVRLLNTTTRGPHCLDPWACDPARMFLFYKALWQNLSFRWLTIPVPVPQIPFRELDSQVST